jgi:hypothetical protein
VYLRSCIPQQNQVRGWRAVESCILFHRTMMSDISVVLVGCGAPLKSMGWYHATQILHEDKDCNM